MVLAAFDPPAVVARTDINPSAAPERGPYRGMPPVSGASIQRTAWHVRLSDLPDPHSGDLIVVGADSFTIQGEPVRDREQLIWTLDLRPTV